MFNKKLKLILILSIVGLFFSLYTVYEHYTLKVGETSLCDLSSHLSCTTVLTSKYAYLFNIPLAFLGVSWFGILVIMVIFHDRIPKKLEKFSLFALFGWSFLGFLFVFYFIYLEFVIGALCPVCTIIHIITFFIFFHVWKLFRNENFSLINFSFILECFLIFKWIILIVIFVHFFLLITFNLPLLVGTVNDANYEESLSIAKCLTNKGWGNKMTKKKNFIKDFLYKTSNVWKPSLWALFPSNEPIWGSLWVHNLQRL